MSDRPPLSFTELTCQFAPESRQLAAGKVTRYIGGEVDLFLNDGAADGVYLIRRKTWGAKWGKRKPQQHPFDGGFIGIEQTPADYESGANYELIAYDVDYGASVRAAIDFPPGSESLGRHGTELIRAFPLVRTESEILLWIRADTGIWDAAIDAEAYVRVKKRLVPVVRPGPKRRGGTWRMDSPQSGASAFLLLDNLHPGVEYQIHLCVDVAPDDLFEKIEQHVGDWRLDGDFSAVQTERLTLTAATLPADWQLKKKRRGRKLR